MQLYSYHKGKKRLADSSAEAEDLWVFSAKQYKKFTGRLHHCEHPAT